MWEKKQREKNRNTIITQIYNVEILKLKKKLWSLSIDNQKIILYKDYYNT